MKNKEDEGLIIICPTEEKYKLLKKENSSKKLVNQKFMTKEEFKRNYFFSYTEKALAFLMNKYHYHIDVAKTYLKNLYIIDDNKFYKEGKLRLLQTIKKDLLANNLLIINTEFKEYLKNKKIIVKNYDLDKYEEEIFHYRYSYRKKKIMTPVVECNTLEDEINYVCIKIRKLLEQGIDINKIYLTNVTEEYLYTIRKLFSYYQIPINIDMKYSIYGTKVVQDYLNTKQIDLDNRDNYSIHKKLINVVNSLQELNDESSEYKEILIDKLKNTYISFSKKKNAINIKDLFNEEFWDDEYVFVIGLNQNSLPKIEKDIEYISDNIKKNLPLYTTTYLNHRNRDILLEVFSSIKNLFLSYKLSSSFNTYYPSSIIEEQKLEVRIPDKDSLSYTDRYNRIRLTEDLDLYNLYGTKTSNLSLLYSTYELRYRTYQNDFNQIDNNLYLEHLPYPLKLSYTSINTYNECKFKYYLKYVLKLKEKFDNFPSFIGSMYHKILSLYQNERFDFEKEYQNYLSKRDLSLKERLLLVKIKKDLKELIEALQQQDKITGYHDYLLEKQIDIPLDKKVSVVFTGIIDKIMYYQKIEDIYFSIVDYKTGTIDTHIEPMKYGLHMQLPVYLYLIHFSKIFSSPIFTGIYYQNILFNYPIWEQNIDKMKEKRLLLQGYSTDDIKVLERFDPTYEKSNYIKSMNYSNEKGFGSYTKTISEDVLYNLIDYTKNLISKNTDEILAADFKINPKFYDGKNISCEYCSYKDICYKSEKDLIYLDKVENLSFLGGDNNA